MKILLWCLWIWGRKISISIVSVISSRFVLIGCVMKVVGLLCDRIMVWCRFFLSSGLRIKFSSKGVGL